MICPERTRPCTVKNRDIDWRICKIQEILYIGQWRPRPLQSRHLGTSHSSPNRHQLSHCIFLILIDGLKSLPFLFFSFLIFYLFIFIERRREGEREGEKHQCVRDTSISRDLACNPGTCPDWESNWWPFSSQAGTQSTEPHHPGQKEQF